MRPHTKFRANRLIFREVMTFRIFSRWLPSAVLNFEKKLDKFSKSASAHQIWSKSDNRRPRYGRQRHVEFTSGLLFDTFEDYGGKMYLLTKFHTNRTIFGEVITFHIFSRWRPARSRDITICNNPHEVAEVVRTCCSNLISES